MGSILKFDEVAVSFLGHMSNVCPCAISSDAHADMRPVVAKGRGEGEKGRMGGGGERRQAEGKREDEAEGEGEGRRQSGRGPSC